MPDQHFHIPDSIELVREEGNTATFVFAPLEPGFGHSIANPIRRSLYAPILGNHAIVGVRLPNGINHEFTTIPGVYEDVLNILLNFKQVRLKCLVNAPSLTINVDAGDKTVITAGDLVQSDTSFEVLNPDLIICRKDEDTPLNLEVLIGYGYGYVPADKQKVEPGFIPLDASHTPIKNVTYKVEDILVGDRADCQKITLEITTDGSIKPQQALTIVVQRIVDYFNKILVAPPKDTPKKIANEEIDRSAVKIQHIVPLLKKSLSDHGLTTRTSQLLKGNCIVNLADLLHLVQQKGSGEIIKIKGIGKKAVKEIESFLEKNASYADVDFSPYLSSDEAL